MFFRWEPGSAKNIGVSATLGAGAIGLLLAAFQVQGWTMPKSLALALIALLILLIAVALSVIVYETVRAVRRFLEHRATSPSWVSTEKPGLLDYEADGIRASERFTKELNKLTRDTAKLGTRLERHSKAIERSAGKSAKKRQRRANRSAKAIDKSAVFIEKRVDLLHELVKDIARNAEGLIGALELETDDDLTAAKEFRDTLDETHQTTTQTVGNVDEYRQTVRALEQQNPSRSVRIASGRLANSLEGVLKMMRRHESSSRKLVSSLDSKIGEAERKIKQS
jgi:hypothetical protein